MERMHLNLERFFRSTANVIYRYPLSVLLLVTVILAALLSQLPKLGLDTSNESFFRKNSDTIVNYRAFRDQFGREDVIVISVAAPAVFDLTFLQQLKIFHEDLEASVAHVDEVTSLLNARNTRGEGDELIVEDLFEQWPKDQAELEILQQRAMENPIYRNLLLSGDGAVTAVVVRPAARAIFNDDSDILSGFDDIETATDTTDTAPYLTDEQASAFVNTTLELVRQYDSPSFRLAASGTPAVTEKTKEYLRRDMGRFTVTAMAIIILLLYLMFRRISGVFVPVVTVLLTLLSTLSLMAISDTTFKPQTQILPSFLLAVGTASSIHILSMFFKRFDASGDKRQSIADAMAHSASPVLMACLTTAVGLMSFSGAAVVPIAELGIFSGVGILVSLLYTLVLTPALLALLPIKTRAAKATETDFFDRVLAVIARFSIDHARLIVTCCALGTIVAIVGLFRLSFYHNFLEWFPEDEPVRQGMEQIDEQLKGLSTLEIIIDTGRENGVYEPELLQSLDALGVEIRALKHADIVSEKTLSIADVVKEINQALNQGDPAYYRIPDDRNLIAQELLLFENSGTDDLEDIVDSQFSKTRMTVKFNWSDSSTVDAYSSRVVALFEARLPEDYTIISTGQLNIYSHIAANTIASMKKSYMIAIILISVLMIVFIGDLKIGLIAMIPNLSPIFITMGAMGYLGFPLDIFTMFIGSIAIGLAVDDTLHFLHGFNRFHHQTGSTSQAILMTFQTTGRALLITTLVLAGGFFIYTLSSMDNISRFGILTGSTIVLALFGDFVLTPAILYLTVKDRITNSDKMLEGATV